MDYLHKKNFDFVSHALPANTFGVVRFRGSEGFSMCYEFEIDLVSKDAEVDLTTVLKNPVTFTILREDGDIPFNGILAQFEQLHEVDEHIFYRAVLVPKLWWLSLTHHNQVLLNKTVPEIIEEVLKDGGLTSLDFEFKLQKDYPQWEYICQYRESHLSFVSRWMEREGMYYYFKQTPQGEKVIITDTKIAHTDMSEGRTMYYSPTSGLDEPHREEVMKTFICRQKMLPRTLNLKDYNYMKPSMEISGKADVSPDGRGNVYMYGNHFRTAKEGDALAKIRAEELLCQERRFHGDSTIPYLRPGYLFDLEDHYRNDFNQKYLTVDLEHEGSQTAFLLSGIQKGLSEVEEQPYYRNSFMTIPAGVQYRQERKTEKPRFYGTLNAKIDAAGSGKYAELDDQGRYKVILPFDKSGRKDGKASAYFRMAQPYAGTDHGMHFPLHKGTEVLLTFVDGDPDRPIINAAVPNPEHPSQVTSGDQTMSKITTSGGNKIHMEDEEGKQRILMHTPSKGTFIRLGAPNDPAPAGGDDRHEPADYGISLYSAGGFNLLSHEHKVTALGNTTEIYIGLKEEAVLAATFELFAGAKVSYTLGVAKELNPKHEKASKKEYKLIVNKVDVIEKKETVINKVTEVHNHTTEVHNHTTQVIDNKAIELIKEKIAVLETLTQTNKKKIGAIEKSITTFGTKIETIDKSITDIGTFIDNTETKISNIKSLVEKNESRIIKAETSVSNVAVYVLKSKSELHTVDGIIMFQ